MSTGTTLEQALQDFLEARAADPRLTPEAFCAAAPHLLGGLLHVLQALTTSGDQTATAPPRRAGSAAVAPRALGVYAIQRRLGEGGMGTVYLAMDTRLDRPAAVKVMRPEIASEPQARARFLREAKAMAAVRHDHVAAIYSADEEADATTWLAMELLEGEALDAAVKRGVLFDWPTICRLGRETALGLHAAHAKRLIHRDIKPANIWLEAPGAKVKILDFGLARRADADAELTGTGAVLGTPAYMAPEQASGEPVDHRCDLFSLGVLLYRLATGRLPFCGLTAMATIAALLSKEPTPVAELRPDCPAGPAGLADLIGRLLAKDRDRRPPTAQAVADELLGLARAAAPGVFVLTPLGAAADPWAGLDDVTATAPPAASPDARRVGPPRKPRRWLLALPLAFLFGVCGFVVVKIRNRDGTVTEIRVPDGATVEVVDGAGKTVAQVPAKQAEPKAATPVPPAAPAGQEIDYAAERRAAEGITAVGKGILYLRLAKDNSAPELTGKNAKLPVDDFTITGGVFTGTDLNDTDLGCLSGTQIEWLRMDYCRSITAVGLSKIAKCSNLRRIWLNDTDTNDDGLKALESLHNINDINLIDTKCTLVGMASAKNWPNLRWLHCPSNAVNDTVLADIVRWCPEIREISIGCGNDVSFKHLAKLTRLRKVVCWRENLTEANIKALESVGNLDSMRIHGMFDDIAIEGLTPLSGKLRLLEIFNNRFGGEITSRGYRALGRLAELEKLDFVGVGSDKYFPDCDGLRAIAASPRLRDVKLPSLKRTVDSEFGLQEFRRTRPDIYLRAQEGDKVQDYPALTNWPGKSDGSESVAPWSLPKDAPPPAVVPFTAAEAAKHQEVWAKYVKLPVEVENKIGMKFRLIPPGEFGTSVPSGMCQVTSSTEILTRLTTPYYLASTEVTIQQFRAFVKSTGYKTDAERGTAITVPGWGVSWLDTGYPIRPEGPVTVVTRADCHAFCTWLGVQDGANYRLPTESEWEFAARAGRNTFEDIARDGSPPQMWVKDWLPNGEVGPQPCGTSLANQFGLYDMLGNVWEACLGSGIAEGTSLINPLNGSPIERGCSFSDDSSITSVVTWFNHGQQGKSNVGFRVLRQTTKEPLVVPKFGEKPVMVAKGQPLSPQATVSRPATIPGVRSWSVELAGHNGGVGSVAWSPTGDMIATCGNDDQKICLWDRDCRLKRTLLGHEGSVREVAFSEDGSRLASVDFVPTRSGGELRVWDTRTGTCLIRMALPGWGGGVAFSADGKRVAVASSLTNMTGVVISIDSGSVRPLGTK